MHMDGSAPLGLSFPIADCHCHFGEWGRRLTAGRDIEPFPGHELLCVNDVEKFCAKHGVQMLVLVPVYSDDALKTFSYNAGVVECAQHLPEMIVPGFWVDPSPERRESMLAALQTAAEHGVRVLKISANMWTAPFSSDPTTWSEGLRRGMEVIAGYLRRCCGVLQVHTGGSQSDIQKVEALMREYWEGITFHLVHMGGRVSGHFYLVPRFADWLAEGLDVYCDTSLAAGFAVRWLVEEGRKQQQQPLLARILFASDEPWGCFDAELAKVVDAVNGDAELLQRVVFENGVGLYSSRKCGT